MEPRVAEDGKGGCQVRDPKIQVPYLNGPGSLGREVQLVTDVTSFRRLG